MTAREQITSNLTVLTNNSCTSKINFIYYDVLHECKIEFPADSWKLARDKGYTFEDVLEKTDDKVFDLLLWILQFDFDATSHNYFIKSIVLSSLWRPKTTGQSPHEDGRGLDIIKITPNIGVEIVCNSSTPTESGFLVRIRKSAVKEGLITQYFSPWMMYYYNSQGKLVEEKNNGVTDNEKIHLTHVHFTLTK